MVNINRVKVSIKIPTDMLMKLNQKQNNQIAPINIINESETIVDLLIKITDIYIKNKIPLDMIQNLSIDLTNRCKSIKCPQILTLDKEKKEYIECKTKEIFLTGNIEDISDIQKDKNEIDIDNQIFSIYSKWKKGQGKQESDKDDEEQPIPTPSKNPNTQKFLAEIEDLQTLIDIETDQTIIDKYTQEIADVQFLIDLES